MMLVLDMIKQPILTTGTLEIEQWLDGESNEFFLCSGLAALATGMELGSPELTRMAEVLSDRSQLFLHSLIRLKTLEQEEPLLPFSPDRCCLEHLASIVDKEELSDLLVEYLLARLCEDMGACQWVRNRVHQKLGPTAEWGSRLKYFQPFVTTVIMSISQTRSVCDCGSCPRLVRRSGRGMTFGEALEEVRYFNGRVFERAQIISAIETSIVRGGDLSSCRDGSEQTVKDLLFEYVSLSGQILSRGGKAAVAFYVGQYEVQSRAERGLRGLVKRLMQLKDYLSVRDQFALRRLHNALRSEKTRRFKVIEGVRIADYLGVLPDPGARL